jgi:hypothetical protein
MVATHNMESRRYEGKPGRFTEKVQKKAVARAQEIHRQDTQARYRPLMTVDEHGNKVQVKDSQGRNVEAIHGPLTKQGVAAGRYLDPQGRGRELRRGAAATRTNNAMLNEAAIGRAQAGEPTDFVVGGLHQWSQNLAHLQPNNPAAGRTNVAGPSATGGPPPAGLRGTPAGTQPGILEFQDRRMDWQGAHADATHPAARAISAVAAYGERRGAARDERAWNRDEARGLVRPIIGYRVQGGEQNFSNQQFSPLGHGPASRPNAPAPRPVPQVPFGFGPPQPAPPPRPSPNPFGPPAPAPAPAPSPGPRPSTNPFSPASAQAPPATRPRRRPTVLSPFSTT